ncbi:hypothetical protein SAY87_023269 [Trapa incisa]|uniref:Uncharacterized protein n=1 Tax=Trapa incisa TaxID=236973 RepID=A0AAN7K290_9MYRT|nr:hypothetical protein SAY87_023269 [Trapa incisa]
MRNRFSSALSIFSQARSGSSPGQERVFETLKGNVDDLMHDCLTFEQVISNFELHKLTRDHMYLTMMKDHETHLLYKQSFDHIAEEKELLNKRMKELNCRVSKTDV